MFAKKLEQYDKNQYLPIITTESLVRGHVLLHNSVKPLKSVYKED